MNEFWWNWWVELSAAVATTAAVVVALFRDNLRIWFAPPQLELDVPLPAGGLTTVTLTSFEQDGRQEQRMESGRYYHVRVQNHRRWSPATQVQIFLTRLETVGPDGELRIAWNGDVPLKWRHQEVHPLARTIGSAADCDLCSVVKDKWLQLEVLVAPNSLPRQWRKATRVVVSLQARSVEIDSEVLRVELAWDGVWEDGDSEMQRHLVVKELR